MLNSRKVGGRTGSWRTRIFKRPASRTPLAIGGDAGRTSWRSDQDQLLGHFKIQVLVHFVNAALEGKCQNKNLSNSSSKNTRRSDQEQVSGHFLVQVLFNLMNSALEEKCQSNHLLEHPWHPPSQVSWPALQPNPDLFVEGEFLMRDSDRNGRKSKKQVKQIFKKSYKNLKLKM